MTFLQLENPLDLPVGELFTYFETGLRALESKVEVDVYDDPEASQELTLFLNKFTCVGAALAGDIYQAPEQMEAQHRHDHAASGAIGATTSLILLGYLIDKGHLELTTNLDLDDLEGEEENDN